MAKSNRRKRQDRVKAGARRAGRARRRAKAGREQQAAEHPVAGVRGIDTEWLRTELGLTGPLSERLP